jgi:O-methyltransferase
MNVIKRRQMRNIFLQVKDYTMIPEPVFCDNLMLADMVRNVSGCVVECGVWRGGMSAGLCRLLGNEREYYLFDSFEGLPPAQPIDGAAAIRWQQDTKSPQYHDNCSAPPEFARRAMELAGAERYKLCPGFFDKSLPAFKPPKIARVISVVAAVSSIKTNCIGSRVSLCRHVNPHSIQPFRQIL